MSEFADVFDCIECGAQVRFRSGEDGDLLERAACGYCGVVNERALAILRDKAIAERAALRTRRTRTREIGLLLLGVVVVAAGLTGIGIANHGSELSELYAEVGRAHAQVLNVRERQAATLQQWLEAPASPDRDAEISGAENRVRIERARYDEAASAFNAASAGPWGGLCAAVYGLPHAVRLSDEEHW